MSESVFRSVRRPEHRGRSVALRVARWLVVVVVLALVAVVVLLTRKASSTLEPVTLQTLVLNDTDPDALVDEVEGTGVTLVVGVDRRTAPPPGLADLTADPRGPTVPLAIELVHTVPGRETMAVVGFPLDLVVVPPGLPRAVRLDRVQARGGPDAMVATIQEITGIRVDHFVEVDLAGVVGWVDAVGGVEVCTDDALVAPPEPTATDGASSSSATEQAIAPTASATPDRSARRPAAARRAAARRAAARRAAAATATPTPTTTPTPPTPTPTPAATSDSALSAGCQTLDGDAAAGYLASRSDLSQSLRIQRQRVAEQHLLLAKVLERTQLSTVLYNPLRVNRVLDSLDAAIASDVDPGLGGMLSLADAIADFDRTTLQVRVVPTYRRSADGDTLLFPDQATALFDALRTGASLATVGRVMPDEMGPEDVSVLVVNGVGTPGLAGAASQYLSSRGFHVACAVNPADLDPRATFDESQVDIVLQHLSDAQVQLELVVEAMGDLPVRVDTVNRLPPMPNNPECRFDEQGAVDVVVTVGKGFPQ